MSQSKDDKKAPPRPGEEQGAPKRPYATIDLKATEIKTPDPKPEAAKPTGSGPSATSSPSSTTSSAAATGAAKPAGTDAKPAVGAARPDAKPSDAGSMASGKASSAAGAGGKSYDSAKQSGAQEKGGLGRSLGYLGSAIIGGIAALLGAQALDLTGREDPQRRASVDDLNARLARVEQLASQRAAAPADAGLVQRLAEATDRLAKLEEAAKQMAALSDGQTRLATDTQALQQQLKEAISATPEAAARVARLEEALQSLAATAQTPQGRQIPEIARLTTKVGELETQIAQASRKAVASEVLPQLEARLAEARKSEAQLAETVAQVKEESARRGRELEQAKSQAERLEQRIEATRAEAATLRAGVEAVRSELATQLQSVTRQSDMRSILEPIDKRLAALTQQVDGIAKLDKDRQTNAERVLLSLELANLKRLMDTGRPYSEALAQVEKVAGSTVDLSALKAFRDKGVPTVSDISGRFREVARAVLEADQDRSQPTTVSKLIASAKSVVQVRRVGGDVEGDTTEAVLARAEHSLKAGDLEGAAKEAKALKAEVRPAAQAWLAQLDARLAVDRALKAIDDQLKGALAGGGAAAGKGGK